jgi:hypothetical protein
MPADVNWQDIANQRARLNKAGKPIPSTAHITDAIPAGGHYRYKTSPNMEGNWLIGGEMKVNRVLTDEEVMAINEAAGVADLPRFTKFDEKAEGGLVDGYAPGGKVGALEMLAKKLMPLANREANKAKFLESSAVKHPVYHGTGADIHAFDTYANELRGTKTELDLLSPLGSHFAKDPAMANNFTRNIENAAVYKTNLQLKNPKVYNTEMDLRDDILSQGSNHSEVDRMFENPENYGLSSLDEMAIKYDSDPAFRRIVNRDALHESEDLVQETGESAMHQDFLKQLTDSWKKANPEIDGVIYKNEAPKELRGVKDPTAYIAFEPTQIKSATGNTGTFDPLDPDITKKNGGSI